MNSTIARQNFRLTLKLALTVLGMFGFCIAMIPMYDKFAELTGINGKVGKAVYADTLNFKVDEQREVGVDLVTSIGKSTPLIFQVETKQISVHPGKLYEIHYSARNTSNQAVVLRAIPSVAPGLAATDFKLLDCFCFEPLRFEAEEHKQLLLRFVIDPKLAQDRKYIALAISFLNINKN